MSLTTGIFSRYFEETYRPTAFLTPPSTPEPREGVLDSYLEKAYTTLFPSHLLTIQEGPCKKTSDQRRKICTTLHNFFGAHVEDSKTTFRVFAPNAMRVSVVLKKDGITERSPYHMTNEGFGIWQFTIGEDLSDFNYEYEIRSADNRTFYKADPFSFEHRVYYTNFRHESVISSPSSYQWNDSEWMAERSLKAKTSQPLNIYEVFPSAWKRKDGAPLNYREIAVRLANHCKDLGYTHVELLGILEYPNDQSWGYQASGYFAPTSRHGSVEDFQFLVDHLHQNKIGVGLDFVAAHFCVDSFSLSKFDGSPIFEPSEEGLSKQPAWETYLFAFKKSFVRDYLLSSARFWSEVMHVDILRVDAVAVMSTFSEAYCNNSWPLNRKGDQRHFDGRSFLKELTQIVHEFDPSIRIIAEDSTENPKNCRTHEERGFGFDMQWGFGWTRNLLEYFKTDPSERTDAHKKLIECVHLAQNPKIMTCLSHDDFYNKTGSLLSMMPGDEAEKFANLRVLMTFMMTLPPAKLSFMGNEMAQPNAWDAELSAVDDVRVCKQGVQWELIEDSEEDNVHKRFLNMNSKLNTLYKNEPSLWPDNQDPKRVFKWIDGSDTKNSVISFYRSAPEGKELICVHSFGSNRYEEYDINFPVTSYFPFSEGIVSLKEVFNSGSEELGGPGDTNSHPTMILAENGAVKGFRIKLHPLTSIIFEVQRS